MADMEKGGALQRGKLVGASGLAKREVCRDGRLPEGVFDFTHTR